MENNESYNRNNISIARRYYPIKLTNKEKVLYAIAYNNVINQRHNQSNEPYLKHFILSGDNPEELAHNFFDNLGRSTYVSFNYKPPFDEILIDLDETGIRYYEVQPLNEVEKRIFRETLTELIKKA